MLVRKIDKYLVSINNIEDIENYKKVGITTFLFALNDYSIGYEKTFSVEQINNVNEKKLVLINKILDNKQIDDIKKILPLLNVDGFIFEDIGLINILEELNIKGDKILFINHFNCNYESINLWLNYVDSVFVSNELTYKELEEITKKVNKSVILHIFGYNHVMYSKRYLLSNFYKYYGLDIKKKNTIKDKNSDIKYHVREENDGTIFYSNKIFDGRRLLDLDNVLFYYLNTSFIKIDDVIRFINGEKIDNLDNGFLEKETIYKLKGEKS